MFHTHTVLLWECIYVSSCTHACTHACSGHDMASYCIKKRRGWHTVHTPFSSSCALGTCWKANTARIRGPAWRTDKIRFCAQLLFVSLGHTAGWRDKEGQPGSRKRRRIDARDYFRDALGMLSYVRGHHEYELWNGLHTPRYEHHQPAFKTDTPPA